MALLFICTALQCAWYNKNDFQTPEKFAELSKKKTKIYQGGWWISITAIEKCVLDKRKISTRTIFFVCTLNLINSNLNLSNKDKKEVTEKSEGTTTSKGKPKKTSISDFNYFCSKMRPIDSDKILKCGNRFLNICLATNSKVEQLMLKRRKNE